MLYICTRMATVGIKGFKKNRREITFDVRYLSRRRVLISELVTELSANIAGTA